MEDLSLVSRFSNPKYEDEDSDLEVVGIKIAWGKVIFNWVVSGWVWVSSDESDCISIDDSSCLGWSLDDNWDKLLSSSEEATLLIEVKGIEYSDLKSGSFASFSIR